MTLDDSFGEGMRSGHWFTWAVPKLVLRLICNQAQGAGHGLHFEPLSERELEVLRLLEQGASNQEIAKDLMLALSTVKSHVRNILSKLGASNRTQAVKRARTLGLLPDEP